MGRPIVFWKRKQPQPSRAQLNEDLAIEIMKGQLAKYLPSYLAEETTTPNESHAEWLVLHFWAVDYTIQQTLKSPARFELLWTAISDQFRSFVSPLPCRPHFEKIVNERMKEYGDWFSFGLSQCGPTPLLTFSMVVATHILKPGQTLGVGLSTFQQEQNGVDPYTDIAVLTALSSEISGSMVNLAKLLKSLEAKVPGIFL